MGRRMMMMTTSVEGGGGGNKVVSTVVGWVVLVQIENYRQTKDKNEETRLIWGNDILLDEEERGKEV